jgi:superfamily I DNA and/or RNA helicase/predicted DNA-binding WGR domain protein
MKIHDTEFYKFLTSHFDKGLFANDDVVAVMLPLLQTVAKIHNHGKVAGLEKLENIFVEDEKLNITDTGYLIENNASEFTKFFSEQSKTFNISSETYQKVNVGEEDTTEEYFDQSVQNEDTMRVSKPMYLKNYNCFEFAFSHHDPLSDIYVLGMIMASQTLNLNFTDFDDLNEFVSNRKSMVFVNPKIHPAIANIIFGMTELDRRKRWKDLNEIIEKLKNYRDYNPETEYDISKIIQPKKSSKQQYIQEKLRNRLFDNSRRNRLLYYKPNLKFLNLTIASVPQVLNYKNIDPNSLFFWNTEISKKISNNSSISLNKYLRFEDNPYIVPTLDKIRLEANKDVNEYGFSQLKLVLCFLNWYNTKENATEKIETPFLLTPINLTKKKGVKDQFTLEFVDDEVEINPVLANMLKELYGIKLPERIQLSETSITDVFQLLKHQIESNNSGITLENIDKPRIKLIHTQAQSTLSQFNKRNNKRQAVADIKNIAYSYSQDDFQPFGLQLFKQYIEDEASGLEFLIDSDIKLKPKQFSENKIIDREFYTLDEGEVNPFIWEFDTCNMVIGNFNYKKMSLVRDYNQVIDNQLNSQVFDHLFADLSQRDFKTETDSVNAFTKTYNVVASDPTQNKAVLLSEAGENYIIQGPPGTGKSQTIANLVANFVAKGKKILFVCEKRAALDVVFYRLKNQGLDELCCLIHDSQSDKKEFVLNLKSTYESFTKAKKSFESTRKERDDVAQSLENELNILNEFHQFMKFRNPKSDSSIKDILEVLVFNSETISPSDLIALDPFASYSDWEIYNEKINALYQINLETNKNEYLSQHPFKYFSIEAMTKLNHVTEIIENLQTANEKIDDLTEILDTAGFLVNSDSSFQDVLSFLTRCRQAIPFYETNQETILSDKKNAVITLDNELMQLEKHSIEIGTLEIKYPYWSEKISEVDAQNALPILEKSEDNFFNIFNGNYKNVKNQVLKLYDVSKHNIKPKLSLVIKNILQQYEFLNAKNELEKRIQRKYNLGEIPFIKINLKALHETVDNEILSFLSFQNQDVYDEIRKIDSLAESLNQTLKTYLVQFENLSLLQMDDKIKKIVDNQHYFQLYANQFEGLIGLNTSVISLLRKEPISLDKLQKLLAEKTLQNYYASNFNHQKFNLDLLHHTIQKIGLLNKELLTYNGKYIIQKQQNDFNELIKKSEMSVAGMGEAGKLEKKSVLEGRKILENEFGKSMRYKSIRELSTSESGKIIRELKPIWLMSPLSVSDTLPLDENYFDVVIFDEASQITLEEGLPPIYRAKQTIIVGDEMQMPPSNFFGSASGNEDDLWFEAGADNESFSIDADSFLTQGARKFPSIMLGWHYRSKHEALIGFSNASFYNNQLLTIPDVKDHQNESQEIIVESTADAVQNIHHLYEKPISYHYLSKGVYEARSNVLEAQYIAEMTRTLLFENKGYSVGIVAFSMEQQNEIETALQDLCLKDKIFENLLEEEYKRIEDNQFVGLFIKNLENVQGDERDIIIMSTCYGYDPRGKMLMNFGPINKRGGEKRLNVLFSRAKKSMCVVSSIKYTDIKNEYNDGANYFRKYLQYAELVSLGNLEAANNVLNSISNASAPATISPTAVAVKIELEKQGYCVTENVGQSSFKCSLGVKKSKEDTEFILGISIDDESHYVNDDVLEQYFLKSELLKHNGWKLCQIYTKDWIDNQNRVIKMLKSALNNEPFFETVLIEKTVSIEVEEPVTVFLSEEPAVIQNSDPNATKLISTENGSNKFWEVSVTNSELIIQYGKIGTKGQKLIKNFDSEETAKREMQTLIRQKMARGYREV